MAAATAALAGCGSSTVVGTAADPAGAIPASAALYASAAVRPHGTLSANALAAGKALTHQADPYLRLLVALQTPGAPALDYKRDIAPWLGPNAGVYVTSPAGAGPVSTLLLQGLLGGTTGGAFPFAGKGAQGALVLDTSNVSKAQTFLDGEAQHAGAHTASYRGISYKLSGGGVAFGIVDRFAVIGSEAGMHGVIDTTLGAPSLGSSGGYAKLLAAAPAGTLAHVYSAAAGSRASATAAPQEGIAAVLGVLAAGREANISLVASAGSLALDADTLASADPAGAGGLLSADPQSARALEELPGESWLAVGLGHAGTQLTNDIHGLQALASLTGVLGGGSSGVEAPNSTLSVSSLLEGVLTPLKLLGANTPQAKRQFASWIGSAGLFASGGSLLELQAGVVIDSTNAQRSRAAVAALGDQLSKGGATILPASIAGAEAAVDAKITGLPLALYIAAGRSSSGQAKFVLGLGEASVTSALNPSSTLAGASSRGAAGAALGEGAQPSIIADFPTLLALLEGVGLTGDPSISKFVPYLRATTTLAGGGHELGAGIQRFRLVLGLQ